MLGPRGSSAPSPAPVLRRDATARPTTVLTRHGRQELERRLTQLHERCDELQRSIDDGDHSRDTAEQHHVARLEAGRLADLLTEAGAVEALPDDPNVVEVGDTVAVRMDDGSEEEYIVVHPIEATVDDSRISVDSPLARALLGHHVGDEVEVVVPFGVYRCQIVHIRRGSRSGEP